METPKIIDSYNILEVCFDANPNNVYKLVITADHEGYVRTKLIDIKGRLLYMLPTYLNLSYGYEQALEDIGIKDWYKPYIISAYKYLLEHKSKYVTPDLYKNISCPDCGCT